MKTPYERNPGLNSTDLDRQINQNLNDSNSVRNMFDRNIRHRVWTHGSTGKPFQSSVNSGYLMNPNAVESRTGMSGTNYTWNPLTWLSGNSNTLDNRGDLYKNRRAYYNALQSMDKNGFTLAGNGAEYSVRPETVEFLNATSPFYTTPMSILGNSSETEKQIRNQIGGNVRNLYEKQGIWQGMSGFSKYNTTIQQDLNAMYQHALWEMQSKDPKVQKHGRDMMGVIARGQQVFNEARPEVTKGIQAKVQPYRNFLNNNWWWMLPAGGLLIGALAGGFGGNGGQQRPVEPGVMSNALPEGWTAPLVNPATEMN